MIATITHPLVGYETETVVWARYLGEGAFQPTIASAFGLGRGWGAIWPFFLAAGGAVVLAALSLPRMRISARSLAAGLLALAAWALFAALAPTLLGIDTRGLREHRRRRRPHGACTRASAPTRCARWCRSPPPPGCSRWWPAACARAGSRAGAPADARRGARRLPSVAERPARRQWLLTFTVHLAACRARQTTT